MPIFSDSPSATTPRTIGSRQSRRFFIADSNDSVVDLDRPERLVAVGADGAVSRCRPRARHGGGRRLQRDLGLLDEVVIAVRGAVAVEARSAAISCGTRTATAQVETPRIITPSSTAWPPIGASRADITPPSASITSEVGSEAPLPVVAGVVGSALMSRTGIPPGSPMVVGSERVSAERGAWRPGAGSAPRGHRCRPASACPCRTGGTRSRSRACISGLVERVVNSLPHVQRTWASTYSGWMPSFMRLQSSDGV